MLNVFFIYYCKIGMRKYLISKSNLKQYRLTNIWGITFSVIFIKIEEMLSTIQIHAWVRLVSVSQVFQSLNALWKYKLELQFLNMATPNDFHKVVNEPHQLIPHHNILPLWADLLFSLTSQTLACWVCCRDIMPCLNHTLTLNILIIFLMVRTWKGLYKEIKYILVIGPLWWWINH